MKPDAILIAGPTASGKSAVGISLAQQLGGAIVNVDSMQVYSNLRVITARPSVEEEKQAPHYLYGYQDPATRSSVGIWLGDATKAFKQLQKDKLVPIFVGGTGLYFQALTEGLSAIPDVSETVVQNWKSELDRVGSSMLHELLVARDPKTASLLDPSDGQRITRALSVLDATGRPLSDWQDQPNSPALLKPDNCLKLFIDPPREILRQRINARFDEMMGEGALEEVAQLMEMDLDPSLPVMRAHGVPHLINHLKGNMPLDRAVQRAKGDTRRYAKRQRTWFRHQMSGWQRVDPLEKNPVDVIISAFSDD